MVIIILIILLLKKESRIKNQLVNLKFCNINLPISAKILVYNESNSKSTSNLLSALNILSNKFIVQTVNNFNNIDTDINLIIIPGGDKIILTIAERDNIIKYIERGNNLLAFGNNCFPIMNLNITCYSSFKLDDYARGQVLLKFSSGLFKECYCKEVDICNKLFSFNQGPIFKILLKGKMPANASSPNELVYFSSGVPLTFPDINFGNEYPAIVSNKYGKGKIILSSPEPYNLLDNTIDLKRISQINLFIGLILYSAS